MPFEQYVPAVSKKHSKIPRSNSVFFNAKMGKLSIRQQIYKEHIKTDYVKIYFDSEQNKIGIQPAQPNDKGAIKISGQATKSIQLKRFITHYGITIPEKINIPVEWNTDHNMITFKITA